MASIKIVDSLPNETWIQFVEEHPSGNIFHTPFMMKVFQGAKNYEPFLLASINREENKIQSLILSCRVKVFDSFLSRLSSRMVCYGGIIHSKDRANGEILSRLLEFYDRSFKNRSLLTEIRNMDDTESFKDEMIASGYEYEQYLNYLVDLRRDAQSIFRTFSKGRKSDIKALEKMGVYTKEVTERKEIETVYEILDKTYSKIKVPFADISLFETVMEHLYGKGMAKFYLAKLKDQNIASLVALLYKGNIITWYYGSDPEFDKLTPTSLLIWHLIKWGSSNGYQSLDFGGAGRPDEEYGVRDFKARFHGELTNYGRYIKVYSPALLKIANVGYRIYRKTALPYDWQK